jgi:hypothetical protein
MSERKYKTPEQVLDEDYKVAPTSADKENLEAKKTKATRTSLPELCE